MKNFIKKIQNCFWAVLLILVLTAAPLSVLAISSPSYQIDPAENTTSITHSLNSASYKLEGAIEPISGLTASTSYKVESGASFSGYCGDGFIDPGEECEGSDLNGQTCVTKGFASGALSCTSSCAFDTSACTSGGGGGGGGGGGTAPAAPKISVSVPVVTYAPTELLYGTREANSTIYINGSNTGVTYPTSTTWQKMMSLVIGANPLSAKASNAYGQSSPTGITITRLEKWFGDITGDDIVNDYDLSLLAYNWGKTYAPADFNDDGIVDDYDLSMMAAVWDVGA